MEVEVEGGLFIVVYLSNHTTLMSHHDAENSSKEAAEGR